MGNVAGAALQLTKPCGAPKSTPLPPIAMMAINSTRSVTVNPPFTSSAAREPPNHSMHPMPPVNIRADDSKVSALLELMTSLALAIYATRSEYDSPVHPYASSALSRKLDNKDQLGYFRT